MRYLILRTRVIITESASGEDDLLARALGIMHGLSWVNLRRTDRCHERTSRREGRVEADASGGLRAVGIEADIAESSNAEVARGVQYCCSSQTDLAVLGALAHC